MISEKRAYKHDFLKGVLKAFDLDVSSGKPVRDIGIRLEADYKVDVSFVLFVTDNLATLEYKLQEEVMIVVQQLSSLTSSSVHIASMLEDGELEGEAEETLDGKAVNHGAVRPAFVPLTWLITRTKHSPRPSSTSASSSPSQSC